MSTSWYALFVKTGCEEEVKRWLNLFFIPSEIKALVPKRYLLEYKQGKICSIVRTLFPGYVLIETQLTEDMYYRLQKIPIIYTVLHNGEYFYKIPYEEIELICQLTKYGDVVGLSRAYYNEEQRLEIVEGPLKGLEPIIKKVNKRKNRVKVNLSLHGQCNYVDLGVIIS